MGEGRSHPHKDDGVVTARTLYSDPTEALGMCLISAEAFSTAKGWGLVQVTGLTYPGREHWASVSVDGEEWTVRDGTMRQFSPDVPCPWLGELDDWLDDMSELLNDHLRFECFIDSRDRAAFVGEWVREDITPGQMVRR
jgi:hypothetical protein